MLTSGVPNDHIDVAMRDLHVLFLLRKHSRFQKCNYNFPRERYQENRCLFTHLNNERNILWRRLKQTKKQIYFVFVMLSHYFDFKLISYPEFKHLNERYTNIFPQPNKQRDTIPTPRNFQHNSNFVSIYK